MKWPAITSTGATNSAICIDEPIAMPSARSILFLLATSIAVECSAALPTTATTTTPMKTLPRPSAVPAASTASTRNSLTKPDEHGRADQRRATLRVGRPGRAASAGLGRVVRRLLGREEAAGGS